MNDFSESLDAWHNLYWREKAHRELLALALDFMNVAAYLPFNPMWPGKIEANFMAYHDEEFPTAYLNAKLAWEKLTPQEKMKNNR